MASSAVYAAVKGLLEASWATTPLAFENENFTRNGGPFVMLEISGTLYGQQSIGAGSGQANRWDEEGVIYLHIMVPTGTGAMDARNYAKSLANIFRGTTLLGDNLEFMDASIGMGDLADEEGIYWRITLTVDWRYIEA